MNTGRIGDFVIYSFPKMFPIQIGGLLVTNLANDLGIGYQLDAQRLRYVKNVLSHYIVEKESIIKARQYNYHYLNDKFCRLNLEKRFKILDGTVPGVYMFRTDKTTTDLPELKKYFYAHGVQCSVFYGEQAFFIPVHQALTETDMLYFYEVIKSFLERG